MRIALGILSHEANCFSPQPTGWAEFESRQLVRGDAMLADWETTRTEQAGAMSILSQTPECEVVPTLAARGPSGGPIRGEVFRALLEELLILIQGAMPLDGVLLVLHGAMMADGEPDATGEVLARVREVVGRVPIVGTLDLHANITQRMVNNATALVGYQTAPHVDMYETGQRAARLLLDTIAGTVSPTMAFVKLPMILPPENSTHNWGPLAAVINKALALEREGSILHGGVYPVQPWLDTPDVGSSVVVITDGDPQGAAEQAQALAEAFWARREWFVSDLIPPDKAVQRALQEYTGMVILCDSADSTTSGSTGDSTAILQACLRATPLPQIALLNIVDPVAVEEAISAGVGETVTVQVGGRRAPNYFQPVTLTGYVKTISDGVFRFKGPGMRGVTYKMGRSVVLYHEGIHLLVMEHPVSQWDPQMYRSVGEEPADARIVQVKSPMAFRAAYEGLFEEVLIIDAPGAASPKLAELPWKHIRRPIYPLDPDTAWP